MDGSTVPITRSCVGTDSSTASATLTGTAGRGPADCTLGAEPQEQRPTTTIAVKIRTETERVNVAFAFLFLLNGNPSLAVAKLSPVIHSLTDIGYFRGRHFGGTEGAAAALPARASAIDTWFVSSVRPVT